MKVYGGVCKYIEVYGGIWRYEGAPGAPGAGAPAAGELMPSELYHQGGMRIGDYTFIYLTYLHIPSYTCIYFKICNIRNMRANLRFKNGHNSRPRAFPKVRI